MEQAPVRIGSASAEWQADFLEKRLKALKARLPHGERLSIINSVATDICATMRSL
jgi:hypothetical protein